MRLAAALLVALLVALGPGAAGLSRSSVAAASVATPTSCSSTSGPESAYIAAAGGRLSAIALPTGHQEWSVRLPRSFSGAISVTLAPCTPVGYVLVGPRFKGSAALIRFEESDGSLGRPIPVGLPGAVSISPNGATAYVANSGGLEGLPGPTGTTVTPVDLSTDRRLRAIGVGGQPGGIAITPSGSTVLVTLTKGSVVPISTATRRVGRPIPLPSSPLGLTDPGSIAIDRAEDVALVSNLQMDLVVPANVVYVINLRTLRSETPITLESHDDSARALTVPRSGRTAFALSLVGVTTIDLATRTVGTLVANSELPEAMAIGTSGRTLYLAQELQPRGSELVPIDTATLTAGAAIATFSGEISDIAIGLGQP